MDVQVSPGPFIKCSITVFAKLIFSFLLCPWLSPEALAGSHSANPRSTYQTLGKQPGTWSYSHQLSNMWNPT